jgi:cellulose biosynthesis protein BcsQ
MTNIHLIGGEKGGVGKSVVARLLAQYFIDN